MIRPIETKLNISLLENDFSADWKKRFNIEENTILSCYNTVSSESRRRSVDSLHMAIFHTLMISTESKQGNAFEDFVFNITKQMEGIKYLETCYSNGIRVKCQNIISIDKRIFDYIIQIVSQKLYRADLSTPKALDKILQKIYKMSKEYKKEYTFRTKMYKDKQDLDLGFIDEITGQIYLFEEKLGAKFGGDVEKEHLKKYFLAYANYVYNNECSFEDININMLIFDNEGFKRLCRGGNGFITLEDFFEKFNIKPFDENGVELDFQEIKDLFYDVTEIKSSEFNECVDRFEHILKINDNIIKGSETDCLNIYYKHYEFNPIV